MVGIGGAGMSALARLYLEQGVAVSGSDQAASATLEDLAQLGAQTYVGSDPERIDGADVVVYSSAVPDSDAELHAARASGVRAIKHAVALGELFNTKRGIAIAGTHGKTTTTSMVSLILERAGLQPSFHVGGEMLDLGTSARHGAGEWFVIEADEFDRRFLEYDPEIAVINNVEPDHFEYYGTYERMRGAFADFLRRVRPGGTVVAWGEDARLTGLIDEVGPERVARFGFADAGRRWDVTASDLRLSPRGSDLVVEADGEHAALRLVIPGVHNVRNALAAVTTSRLAGVPLTSAVATLAEFHGARRRLQLLADRDGIKVFDDYAHHPTAVRLMIEALRRQVAPGGRLWAVFQPHLRTRTEELFDEFTSAFTGADAVVIVDVYSPKGREPEGRYRGSAELVTALGHPNARHVPTLDEARAILGAELRPGDVAVVMGAGTIERLSQQVAQDVTARGG
jgi:UDP-N-acetylmuramate--alanine ligase